MRGLFGSGLSRRVDEIGYTGRRFDNDIQSYHQKDDFWDKVTIWTKIYVKPAEQAFKATLQRQFKTMDEYTQLAQCLLERYPKEKMEPLVVDFCQFMYYTGFNRSWQSHVQRYKSTVPCKNILEQLFLEGPSYHVVEWTSK